MSYLAGADIFVGIFRQLFTLAAIRSLSLSASSHFWPNLSNLKEHRPSSSVSIYIHLHSRRSKKNEKNINKLNYKQCTRRSTVIASNGVESRKQQKCDGNSFSADPEKWEKWEQRLRSTTAKPWWRRRWPGGRIYSVLPSGECVNSANCFIIRQIPEEQKNLLIRLRRKIVCVFSEQCSRTWTMRLRRRRNKINATIKMLKVATATAASTRVSSGDNKMRIINNNKSIYL